MERRKLQLCLIITLMTILCSGCARRKTDGGDKPSAIAEKEKLPAEKEKSPITIKPTEPIPSAATKIKPPVITSKTISAISRKTWGAQVPQAIKMTRMGGCNKITIHHEGSKPNYDNTVAQVATTLRNIQAAHGKTLGAGDIGYHFVIDRQGRVWQGRDLQYQGAHTKANNPHNIGIMCLGNFETQKPTPAQIDTLTRLCHALMTAYHIAPTALYGHRDLRSTACPGKFLYPYLVNIRKTNVPQRKV